MYFYRFFSSSVMCLYGFLRPRQISIFKSSSGQKSFVLFYFFIIVYIFKVSFNSRLIIICRSASFCGQDVALIIVKIVATISETTMHCFLKRNTSLMFALFHSPSHNASPCDEFASLPSKTIYATKSGILTICSYESRSILINASIRPRRRHPFFSGRCC